MTKLSIPRGAAGLVALLLLLATGSEAARPPVDRIAENSTAGRLLVATPELEDPNFRHTVVYVAEHDGSGAMGLVVNRVLGTGPIAELLEGLSIEGDVDPAAQIEVHYGGPVAGGRGLVLHSPDFHGADTVVLSDLAALTGSPDVLSAIAAGKGPRRSLFALGHAGWAPGQLEAEIAAGAWVIVEADEALLFDDETESKWQRALDRQGIDL